MSGNNVFEAEQFSERYRDQTDKQLADELSGALRERKSIAQETWPIAQAFFALVARAVLFEQKRRAAQRMTEIERAEAELSG